MIPGRTTTPFSTSVWMMVLCLMANGCALLTKSEPRVPRYFSPEISAASGSPRAGPTAEALELRLGRVSAGYHLRENIVYRNSAHELGYYEDRRWTERPELYLQRALVRALFEQRGMRQVIAGGAPTLAVELVSFEEVREPLHVGRVQLSYTLRDDRVVRLSRTVVLDRPITESAETKGPGDGAANAMVAALSEALTAAVDGIATTVAAELATRRTATVPDVP